MSAIITVPAELVGQVRIGLQSVLGDAAEDITQAVERPQRERRPESAGCVRTTGAWVSRSKSSGSSPGATSRALLNARW